MSLGLEVYVSLKIQVYATLFLGNSSTPSGTKSE